MISLRPYQEKGVEEIRDAYKLGLRSVLFYLPTGGGKCLGKGTPILMYDGTIKLVEDVVVGDILMGPDSTPRTVRTLARGQENLYRINQINGDSYVVNESHILSLKKTNSGFKYPCQKGGAVVNVSVAEYLKKSASFKHTHKGWKAPATFQETTINPDLPPYMLGVWLGDGNTRGAAITTIDPEILQAIDQYADERGMQVAKRISGHRTPVYYIKDVLATHGRGHFANRFLNALREVNVFGDKHVPHAYKTGSESVRLEVLAGLIDTDGSLHNNCYDVVFKIKQLADDTAFLARSVGLRAHVKQCQKTCVNTGAVGTYYRIGISGDIEKIPVRIARKKAAKRQQKKDVLVTGFKVESLGVGDYYGFEIDGDHLFMLGDFTVTHNTYTFSYIADSAGQKGGQVLICAHRKELVMQACMSLAKLGVEHSIIAPADVVSAIKVQQVRELRRCFVKSNSHVAVGSVQTIVRRLPTIAKPTLIIIDEAHHSTAGQWRDIINYFPKARILGVTATPCRTDGQGLGTHVGGVFDAMVLGPSMQELINLGSLVPAKIFYPGKFIDTTGMRLNPSGDFNQKAMDVAFESNRPTIVGNAVSFYKKHADGKKAVVFCTSVAAAQKTAETFCEAGYRFVSLDGTMDDVARRETVRQLSAGEIDGITSCDIVSEGFDCPDLEVAILMRPTNSESLYLQQIGRVLRPAPGKAYGIIIDMVGNTVNPALGGLPHWEREWSLDGGAQSKKGDGTEPKKLVQICTCPKCNAVHDPRPKCPECGHIYKVVARQIEQVEGDLVEMTPEMEVKLKEQKARKQQQGRAQSIDSLIYLALGQNRNPGWAYHVFINRPGNTMTHVRDGVESVITQLSDQIKLGTAKDPAKVREQLESVRKAFGHKLTEHGLELRI